jgi:DNA polymerase III delta subunit
MQPNQKAHPFTPKKCFILYGSFEALVDFYAWELRYTLKELHGTLSWHEVTENTLQDVENSLAPGLFSNGKTVVYVKGVTGKKTEILLTTIQNHPEAIFIVEGKALKKSHALIRTLGVKNETQLLPCYEPTPHDQKQILLRLGALKNLSFEPGALNLALDMLPLEEIPTLLTYADIEGSQTLTEEQIHTFFCAKETPGHLKMTLLSRQFEGLLTFEAKEQSLLLLEISQSQKFFQAFLRVKKALEHSQNLETAFGLFKSPLFFKDRDLIRLHHSFWSSEALSTVALQLNLWEFLLKKNLPFLWDQWYLELKRRCLF